VRALLIVNPRATTTTRLRRDVIAHALASQLELEVVETRYRGHAGALARMAAADGHQLVLTLGGDGTVNEAINGLLGKQPAAADTVPALAALPGGNANVFSRALGLASDPVDATGAVIEALRAGRSRRIGLGHAESAGLPGRYFAFNAGLGLDAEVVRAIEGLRAHGRTATPGLYLWTALRQFYAVTDRRHPALILERGLLPPVSHLFFGFVSNTAPWTYLGRRPVNPSPDAAFDAGLDFFALRRLSTLGTLNALRQMISRRSGPPSGRDVVSLHDERLLDISATRPVALQVDGEYVGERHAVTFRCVPDALRVIA
jgi:diacylglycerol kinase family enzyme